MKKPVSLLLAFLLPFVSFAMLFIAAPAVSADYLYTSNNLITYNLFSAAGSMSANDIQVFLNQENSGIRTLTDTESCSPPTPKMPDPYAGSYYHNCGSTQSAAQIIYDAAQAYDISPRVILATMQKEQSLVTDPTFWQNNMGAVNCAMGYLSCGSISGFFNQVDGGTWQLRTDVELMEGRNWWGYTPSSYPCGSAGHINAYNSSGQQVSMRVYSTGLYGNTTVTFDNPTVYNPSGTLIYGGKNPAVPETIGLANSSTAALYCYTPYVGPISTTGYSGSYNFVQSYEQWWGSTTNTCGNDPVDLAAPNTHVPGDFNGTGRTAAAIFRPSDGCWHVRAYGDSAFGNTGDIPVPADYNGDGRTDIAVFRPSTGDWHIRGVGDFSAYGQSGDIPVPGDYNGDGRADAAVYRPTQLINGEVAWHIRGVGDFGFGHQGDIPVPGDYNGDGRTDIAVFRPSTGDWHIRGVGDYSAYGLPGDIPVPGDYNGDGKTDAAVFRPTQLINGEVAWHIRGVGDFGFGHPGDIPVPADYNGDGRTDIAVFRPSTGDWHIRGVGDYSAYGQSSDIPAIQTLNALLLQQYGLIPGY